MTQCKRRHAEKIPHRAPHRRRTPRNPFLKATREIFFGNVDNFSFFQVIPSFRNLKFLAGNVITGGDINSVAQHLRMDPSMPLYAIPTL
jgi:hypothetical protein